MQCFIHDTKKRLLTEDVFDKQSQWEISKYEMQKFSLCLLRKKEKKQHELESKLKILEKYLFLQRKY